MTTFEMFLYLLRIGGTVATTVVGGVLVGAGLFDEWRPKWVLTGLLLLVIAIYSFAWMGTHP